MKKMNSAFSIRGTLLKIPFEGNLIYKNDRYSLLGHLIFPENTTVRNSIIQISNVPLNEDIKELIPEWPLENASVCLSPGLFTTELRSSGVIFSYHRQDQNGLLIFSLEKEKMSENSLFKTLFNNLGIRELVINCVLGKQRIKPALSGESMMPVEVPASVFDDSSSILFTRFNLSDAKFTALKMIGDLFNLPDISLLIGTKSSKGWMCYINLPEFKGGILEAKDLNLNFTVDDNPMFSLDGSFIMKIGGKSIGFKTHCSFGEEIVLGANQLENERIDLSPFYLKNMALALRCGTGVVDIAMCGGIELRKLNLFGAIAFGYDRVSKIVSPKMFSLAVSDITLKELIESVAGINIKADWLNKFSINGVSLTTMPYSAKTFDTSNAIDWCNSLRKSVEPKSVNGNTSDFTCEVKNDRISIIDKSYMRHYALLRKKDGELVPQVEAQFLFSKEELTLGEYVIERGAFVCARLKILGVEVITYLNIKQEESVTACFMIAPITTAGDLLRITGTEKPMEGNLIAPPPAIVSSIIGRSSQQKGAVCYFSADKSKGVQFYLDAHISLLKIIDIQSRIIFTNGFISIHTSGTLLKVLDYSLSISCSYEDFSSAQFSASLVIDTTKLKKALTNVQKKIEEAKEAVKKKQQQVEGKLNDAKGKVAQLQNQINSFNNQIEDKKRQRKKAGFFKKIKISFQIAGLEIAKAAVHCAMGIAKGVLDLAMKAVNLSFSLAQGALSMVNTILKGVMNLFYIEYFNITASVGRDNGFLFDMKFVLFGSSYEIKYTKGNLDGNIVGELDDKMTVKAEQAKNTMLAEKKSGPDEFDLDSLELKEFDQMEFNLDTLVNSIKDGGIAITSEKEIIKEVEYLYNMHIDRDVQYEEKEEIETSYLEDLEMVRKYTEISDIMNQTTQEALSELNIEEVMGQTPEGFVSKSDDENAFRDLMAERDELLAKTKILQENNTLLNNAIDKNLDEIKNPMELISKDGSMEDDDFVTNWNKFSLEMENKLVTEAAKASAPEFLIPGYEPEIIDSVREYSTLVRKDAIEVPEWYQPRLDNE